MNCNQCQEKIYEYLEGKLPDDIKTDFETHISVCSECTNCLQLLTTAERVYEEEKKIESNPFLSTRIMSDIDELELKAKGYNDVPVTAKILKPVFITIVLVLAVFLGIVEGNILKTGNAPNYIPEEVTFINDATIESVNVFANQ
jgi:hypothetical protein